MCSTVHSSFPGHQGILNLTELNSLLLMFHPFEKLSQWKKKKSLAQKDTIGFPVAKEVMQYCMYLISMQYK